MAPKLRRLRIPDIVAVDGKHYVDGYVTRKGIYPYCDVLDLSSYSQAKSVAGAISLLACCNMSVASIHESVNLAIKFVHFGRGPAQKRITPLPLNMTSLALTPTPEESENTMTAHLHLSIVCVQY